MYEIVDIDIIIGFVFLKMLYWCWCCYFVYEIVDIDDKFGFEYVWLFFFIWYY